MEKVKAWNSLRAWYFSLPASRKRLLRNVVVRSTLILMALVLAAETYYAYHFYEDSRSNPEAADTRSSAAVAEPEGEAAFVHRATPQNITNNSTYLSSPLTDGEPEALISVTQSWNPGGGAGTYNDHPIGVWYDPASGQWAIFNQDRAPMSPGVSFNVVVWAESG